MAAQGEHFLKILEQSENSLFGREAIVTADNICETASTSVNIGTEILPVMASQVGEAKVRLGIGNSEFTFPVLEVGKLRLIYVDGRDERIAAPLGAEAAFLAAQSNP